jgi:hypothetical protein
MGSREAAQLPPRGLPRQPRGRAPVVAQRGLPRIRSVAAQLWRVLRARDRAPCVDAQRPPPPLLSRPHASGVAHCTSSQTALRSFLAHDASKTASLAHLAQFLAQFLASTSFSASPSPPSEPRPARSAAVTKLARAAPRCASPR